VRALPSRAFPLPRAFPSMDGFTLIEVLVALMIVAFGMGAVMTSLTSAASNTERLREKSFAEWVGLNQLALARLTTALPAVGTTSNEVDFGGSRWHWQQTVENFVVPTVLQLTIQVRHADAPNSSSKSKANEDWVATVFGFRGSAIAYPQDTLANWDSVATPPPNPNPNPTPTPGQPGASGAPGVTPAPGGAPPPPSRPLP